MSYAKQSEILFLWDGENWNPNGDMLNSNAPRYDEISRKVLVSDVRIKRTIRDYILQNHNFDDNKMFEAGFGIFVKETLNKDGHISTGENRVKDITEAEAKQQTLLVEEVKTEVEKADKKGKKKKNDSSIDRVEILKQKCIDVRAFGGVFPVGGETNNLTGSIQFKMSKSLNQTEITYIKGTGAFASGEGKENKTFREEYMLPYAIFATYGIVNALNSENTKLTDSDVETIVNALWHGTKNLISRSKFGQLPRFLLKITYKEAGTYIGGLDNLLILKTDKENEIKSINDYTIDFSKIVEELKKYSDKVEKVEYISDESLNIENLSNEWQKNKKVF